MGKMTSIFKRQEAATPSPAPVAASMPEISLDFKRRYIKINGVVFELLKSDADIISDALRMAEEAEKLDVKDEKAVLKKSREISLYIEAILGTGALDKISGGVRMGIVDELNAMNSIAGAVYEAYQTAIALDYGKK